MITAEFKRPEGTIVVTTEYGVITVDCSCKMRVKLSKDEALDLNAVVVRRTIQVVSGPKREGDKL